MRIILLLLLAMAAGCSEAQAPARPEQAEVRLQFNNGACSGTAVGPNAILTAAHCVVSGSKLRLVNSMQATEFERARIFDGNEHVILFLLDVTFDRWAEIGPRMKGGDRVRMLGHPNGTWATMYREGVVAGNEVIACRFFNLPGNGCIATLYDMNTAGGDSGAALFDVYGRVVGVNTGWYRQGEWTMRVAFPLSFTREQLARIQ